MSDYVIREGTADDAPALTALVNSAFKPVEAFFLENDRLTVEQCHEHLTKGKFLIADQDGAMAACVYVEVRGERGYFGVLSVAPGQQRGGLGKRMIEEAEDYCRRAGCVHMDITVVNLRLELPPVYRKFGYRENGVTAFPPEVPVKIPIHLIKMTKPLLTERWETP